ncbi:MAG TPA: cytochrome P450 [Ilumatobacter sp.]|nr:cytochrome P450 [Ilumatobacter sp.]
MTALAAQAASQGRVRWDPGDPVFRADPYPFYDRLRAEAPAFLSDRDTLVVTRYDDVVRVLRSTEVSRDIEANARIDENDPVAVARRDRRQGAKTILTLDPPDHTRLRRLVSKAFTPSAVERLRGWMTERVDSVLDQAESDGGMELIDQLAFPFPFDVISELLGMPTDRATEVRDWSQALTLGLEPQAVIDDIDAGERALMEMIPYLLGIIDERRANPRDDVLSALIAVEDDGDTMDAAELLAFILLLYVAGHETTVNLIGNGTLALLRHPDQLAAWRADPGLDAVAIDELMRFDGPVQHTVRVAMQPIEFTTPGGAVVAEPGQTILTSLGAANHDPAMFADPHALLLDRANASRHVGFSAGIHYCLGASLAKMEATIAISRLLRRFPHIEMIGEAHWRDRITIRGVDRLQLQFR